MAEDSRYTTFHFSQSNPRGEGQENVAALLRRVASTIEELGDIAVNDLVMHSEITPDGEDWPSITVYYDENPT